jgi:teichuronic acid biosynthesis glycosyltransferase TuaC
MLRVLTLASLFPDASRPTFGPFVERQTLGLAALPDVEVQVVAPIGVPPWPLSRLDRYAEFDAVPAFEVWKGVAVHRPRFVHLPGLGGRFDASVMARAITPLIGRIRQTFPFDLIDAEFFFPDGPAAVQLGAHFGVPVSIKARGADIHHWGATGPTAAQVIDAGRRADGLLAVSSALKDDMVSLGMPEERIRVHYTGVDLSLFTARDKAAAKAALAVAGPLVASVGALIPRKRQALVIEALASVPGANLVLIGKGEDRDRLEALAKARGVADRVRFTGAIPHAEIAQWLAAADVMALPSASEGLANAWVEALAAGTPIVICDIGGAREVLRDEAGGRIVAADPTAISNAIRALLNAGDQREACRKIASRFTWEANAAALSAHLSEIVRQSIALGPVDNLTHPPK